MAQRPSFDLGKMTTADKILAGGALLLFIDSFLAWQRVCITFLSVGACGSASAWGGNGSFFGAVMAILALLLLAGIILTAIGTAMPANVPVPTVMAALTGGTVLFGLIKFLIVLFNHVGYGAFIGLILLIAIGYGGYMKMQETGMKFPSAGRSVPPAPPAPPPTPPPAP